MSNYVNRNFEKIYRRAGALLTASKPAGWIKAFDFNLLKLIYKD